jgi:arylsulfatase A-like enzyme
LAGIKSPPDIDGISYLPSLLGGKQNKHTYLFWRAGQKFAVRQGKWKAVRINNNSAIELYDLSTDVGEQHNVAAEHPELVIRFEALIEEHNH